MKGDWFDQAMEYRDFDIAAQEQAEREMKTCGAPVKGGGGATCQLDAGHRGHHSMVTFGCDGCGKQRRGAAYRYAQDGEYSHGLQFCFLCVVADERHAHDQERAEMETPPIR